MNEALEQIPVNIIDEMRKSYLDYAMSVIIGRALPDARDGLKPVHRRVLFAMNDLGNTYNKAYKKSARIVGDVIGKYHPHGESAVYDTIVRLVQDFSIRYPLIDGQGNFGSVDGDNAAAMRYTEVRMARLADEMLADIDKETVDFGPNYDDSLKEPLVLPAKFPNLLVNGSSGIAVGMATNVPPHNLREIIAATILLIEKPDATLDDLMALVPGPDFPTAGFIYGRGGIRAAYQTGRGIVVMRARAAIEKMSRDREAIIVTEIPYQTNKARLIERIAELVRDKKLEGVSDLRDESDREGMRIVIELKRDEPAQVVLNNLYKLTPMQSSFGIILLAIVNNQPRVLTLREALDCFIEHRKDVVRRRTIFELRKAEARAHILEGLKRALDMLDADHRADPGLQGARRRQAGSDGPVPVQRRTGPGHPGHAAAAPDRPGARENRPGVRGDAQADRAAQGDPGQRKGARGGHHRGAEGAGEELRRRAAHRDRRRGGRDHPRGPHRRRGRRHHGDALRLHQADQRLALPQPGARRQGPDRDDDAATRTSSTTSSSPPPTAIC